MQVPTVVISRLLCDPDHGAIWWNNRKTVVPPGRKIITFFSVSKICEAHCTFNKVNMVWNNHPGHFNRDVLYYCVDRELKSCKDSQEVTRLLGELERVRERNKQLEDELSQTTTSNQ